MTMKNIYSLLFGFLIFLNLPTATSQTEFKSVQMVHRQLIEAIHEKKIDCGKDFAPVFKQFESAQKSLTVKNKADSQKFISSLYMNRLELKEKIDLKKAQCLKQAGNYSSLSRSYRDRLYILSHGPDRKKLKTLVFLKFVFDKLKIILYLHPQ